jgi:hypothetical protein
MLEISGRFRDRSGGLAAYQPGDSAPGNGDQAMLSILTTHNSRLTTSFTIAA